MIYLLVVSALLFAVTLTINFRPNWMKVRQRRLNDPKTVESKDASALSPEYSDASSFSVALRDSDGFFNDITDESWELIKQRVKERTNYFKGPMINIAQPNAWYQENFEPDFTCLHERRVGIPPMGDGPKWVCDPHRLKTRDCLVYSVGSAGNFMFEKAILEKIGRHCEIHTFDPEMTGRYGHLAPSGVQYHAWGFKGKVDAHGQFQRGVFKTMKETISELGHEGRNIDIFKIDCEGCEWTTFEEWFDSGASLRQILVEVHQSPRDKADNFFLSMQKAGYVTFHKEPNIQYAGGKCVEYAFIKLEDSFFEGMQ